MDASGKRTYAVRLCSCEGTIDAHHLHHQLNVHLLPRLIKGMNGCFPTAKGRQPTLSNTLDFSFCHTVIVMLPFRENPV